AGGGGAGPSIGDLIAMSPTLSRQLRELQADGWTIVDGPAGGGSSTNRSTKTITIDSAHRANPTDYVRSLSHEAGHAVQANDYTPMAGHTRDEYVTANRDHQLDGEGRATLNNARVRGEIQDAGGPDIGISGTRTNEYQRIADQADAGTITDEQAAHQIGQQIGQHETTSTTHENYNDYYSHFYENRWDTHHPPAGGGP
ncbi:MAG: hypothetical protein D6754_06485, partial [Alphaproteobacteria bacterium]